MADKRSKRRSSKRKRRKRPEKTKPRRASRGEPKPDRVRNLEAASTLPSRSILPSLYSLLAEGLVFLTLAVSLTWPLAREPTRGIPLGTEEVATVPLFNLWTLWWNADRLQSFYVGYWDAPIFHPVTGTFAFSEPQPLTGFVFAMLNAITGSQVLAYNAIVLLGLTLNGWVACRLLATVGLPWLPSLAGGAMVECLSFVQQELGVLQLVNLAGVLAILYALVRLSQEPTLRRGAMLGLAFAATTLMCGYYGLTASVLFLIGGGWLLAEQLRRERPWRSLGVAALVAVPLLVPVVGPQLQIAERHGLERSTSTASRFSARWEHYRRTPWPQLVPTPGIESSERAGSRSFWPGTVKVVLALVGLAWGLRRGPRRWTAFCVTVLVLALVLSFGPGSDEPSLYRLLVTLYPGFSQLRSPFRFAVFVQVAVALLAAGGLAAVWARTRLPVAARTSLVLGLGILGAAELAPPEQKLTPIPSLEAPLPWLRWIESRASPEDVLAFLPFPRGRRSRDYLESTQWMYWQMKHRRPMINGYSGFFPKPFRDLKASLRDFPDRRSLQMMGDRGVRYCIILQGGYEPGAVERLSTSRYRLRLAFTDDVGKVDVYEVVSPDAAIHGTP